MEDVFTLTREYGAIVPRNMTVGAAAIKRHPADSAYIVIWDIPLPYCDGVDSQELDFHVGMRQRCLRPNVHALAQYSSKQSDAVYSCKLVAFSF
jgi:hypothetical protein